MKTRILVKLPNGNFVHPRHVTCIEYKYYPANPHNSETLVWVRKDAGYGTGTFSFKGDRRDELAAIINQETTPQLCWLKPTESTP